MNNRLTYIIGFIALLVIAPVSAQNDTRVVVIPLGDGVTANSGIEYTAGTNVAITTPDPDQPNQQVISFDTSNLSVSSVSSSVNIRNPYLGLNYIIALNGIFPSRSGISAPALAEITLFGGNFAPRGWAFCHGQLVAINSNTALFALLGTTYGGDGRTSFGLPDLRGRSAIGAGSGPGLRSVGFGERGGVEVITPVFQLQ